MPRTWPKTFIRVFSRMADMNESPQCLLFDRHWPTSTTVIHIFIRDCSCCRLRHTEVDCLIDWTGRGKVSGANHYVHLNQKRRQLRLHYVNDLMIQWGPWPDRPVSRRISRRPPAEKNFRLIAAIDFAKPPAAGRKKIRLSRRFCRRLSRDHNDLHGVKVVIIQQCTL